MGQRSSIYRLIALFGVTGVLSCNQAPPPPAIAAADQDTITVAVEAKQDRPTMVARQAPTAPPAKVEPLPVKGEFAFPDDNGGKLLATILLPANPPSLPATEASPRERILPAFLESPSLPSNEAANSPATLRSLQPKAIFPSALPDRVPLELAPPLPTLPERAPLPTGPLTRQDGRDVNTPADLPILSPLPVGDRAPLTDPTIEFTAQSVISIVLPLRSETTGFIRFTLPDPFENSTRSPIPIVDDPNRALGNPPPPRP